MLLKLLEKIDKKEYLTEEEHKLYLKELEFMAKLFDDLTTGNMVSYHGKFIAMNKKKYYEYRDKQLVSAEAVAFTQQRNEELEKVLDVIKEHLSFKDDSFTYPENNQEKVQLSIVVESKDTECTIHINFKKQEDFELVKRCLTYDGKNQK